MSFFDTYTVDIHCECGKVEKEYQLESFTCLPQEFNGYHFKCPDCKLTINIWHEDVNVSKKRKVKKMERQLKFDRGFVEYSSQQKYL
jgi:hypothetical protein